MSRNILAAIAILPLAACQTASDEGPQGPLTQQPTSDLITIQPEATGPVGTFDYAGTAFPFPYVRGVEQTGSQAFLIRGVGRVRLDPTLQTITVQFEDGGEEIVLTRSSSGSNSIFFTDPSQPGPGGLQATINFAGSGTAGNVRVSDFRTAESKVGNGIIGFATPQADIPSSGTATFRSPASQPFLTNRFAIVAAGEDTVSGPLPEGGSMSLTVDFASGGVTGQLYSGSTFEDFEGAADNFSTNDKVALQVTLENGQLTNGALTGTAALAASVDINDAGTDIRNLSPEVTSSAVDGRLFGDAAQALGGTYGGEGSILGPDGSRVGIAFGGTFLGEQ